jgi:hypothetical protein
MKMRFTIHGSIQVAQYGVELDIPHDIANAGDEAILAWMRVNLHTVDNAPYEHQETYSLIEITQFDHQ